MATDTSIGFEGLVQEDETRGGSTSPADYTVQFTPAVDGAEKKGGEGEDIQLLDVAGVPTDAEKVIIQIQLATNFGWVKTMVANMVLHVPDTEYLLYNFL